MTRPAAHLADSQLVDFLLGKLDDAEQAVAEKHLADCPDCQNRAATVDARDTLTDLFASAATSADFIAPVASEAVADTGSTMLDATRAGLGDRCNSPQPAAGASQSPPLPLAGHPRYRVLRLLGSGGMGSVWLAEHTLMGRQVALKIIRAELLNHPEAVERFRREVQAAAKLQHPNIATAFDAEQFGGAHYLVMEYISGQTLAERLRTGRLDAHEACRIAREVALGLAHAHAMGLTHRDIKPGNLMLMDGNVLASGALASGAVASGALASGRVKILDFGLVVLPQSDTQITGAGVVMGTVDYIAPEQAEDPRSADARSDIYSLGCTLYQLLSGSLPFPAGSPLQKLDARRRQDPATVEGLPPGLWRVIAKMLARDPAERYQTATEVAEALTPFCDAHAEPSPPLIAKALEHRGLRWGTIATIILGIAAWPLYFVLNHIGQSRTRDAPAKHRDSVRDELDQHAAAGATLVRHELLIPSALGQGSIENYRVDGNRLILNTLKAPREVWLNFAEWKSRQLEIRTRVRFTDTEENSRLKFVFLTSRVSEYNVHFKRNGSQWSVILQRWPASSEPPQVVAEQSLPADFGERPFDVAFALSYERLSVAIDGAVQLEGESIDGPVVRHACISADNCRVELEEPHLLVGSNPSAVQHSSDSRYERDLEKSDAALEPNIDTVSVERGKTAVVRIERGQSASADEANIDQPIVDQANQIVPEKILQCHAGVLIDIAVSPDGRTVYTCSRDEDTVRAWDLETGTPTATFAHSGDLIHTIALAENGAKLLTAGTTGRIHIWDAQTGTRLPDFFTTPVLADPGNIVYSIRISPDGHKVAAGCLSGVVVLWDYATREVLHDWPYVGGPAYVLAWSPDSKYLFCCMDAVLSVKDVETKQTLAGVFDDFHWSDAAWLPSEKRLLGVTWSGRLLAVEAASWKPAASFFLAGASNNFARRMTVVRDDFVVVSGVGGQLFAWNPAGNGRPPRAAFIGFREGVYRVVVSADGQRLFAGGEQGKLGVWKIPAAWQAATTSPAASEP